jgi:hypothetical protein
MCSEEELDAVKDSARAKALERAVVGPPRSMDYLEGARYIFNVARGGLDSPAEGDTQIY